MNILYLGLSDSPIVDFLRLDHNDLVVTSEPVGIEVIQALKPDLVISYRYRHILSKDVVRSVRCINLHPSYLPYGRGADSNPWSFLEDTPKGVTIHHMDEGLDTGEIIVQKKVVFKKEKTLGETYDRLQVELINLFKSWWPKIKQYDYRTFKQSGRGTYHALKERPSFMQLLGNDGYGITVEKFKLLYEMAKPSML